MNVSECEYECEYVCTYFQMNIEDMEDIVNEEQKIIDLTGESLDVSLTEEEIKDINTAIHDEMWLLDSHGVRLNLSTIDKQIVLGTGGWPKGWLNDSIIDACHSILKKKYPLLGGLQPCVWATRPQFTTPTAPFLQIINLDPRGNGTHWVLLTNFDCPKGTIKFFDSAHINRVSVHIQKCIAQLLILDQLTMVKIIWVDCDKQRNGMDCGIYAIANMVALATGNYDPIGVSYNQSDMRPHLLRCLERCEMKEFPTKRARRKRISLSGTLHSCLFRIICTCKMPDDSTKFTWQCTTCKKWYHPKCQGIGHMTTQQIADSKKLPCMLCKS